MFENINQIISHSISKYKHILHISLVLEKIGSVYNVSILRVDVPNIWH